MVVEAAQAQADVAQTQQAAIAIAKLACGQRQGAAAAEHAAGVVDRGGLQPHSLIGDDLAPAIVQPAAQLQPRGAAALQFAVLIEQLRQLIARIAAADQLALLIAQHAAVHAHGLAASDQAALVVQFAGAQL